MASLSEYAPGTVGGLTFVSYNVDGKVSNDMLGPTEDLRNPSYFEEDTILTLMVKLKCIPVISL